jgi:transcriptional regulator with XRE-family HTH domain
MRVTTRALWKSDYDAFRARLVEARQSAGLTQRAAAALLGRPHSWVAQSETGVRRVDVVELAHFARIYKKSLKFFAPFL